MEKWRAIPGFEEIYEASDLGRIKRIGAWCDGRMRCPQILSPKRKIVPKGRKTYLSVQLSRDRRRSYHQVHRLVLFAFMGIPTGNQKYANHRNGNTLDNRLENLEWCTASENQLHSYRILKTPHYKGSESPNAKLTEADVLAMRGLRGRGWMVKDIAREFGVSMGTCSEILNNKLWKHI